MKGETHHNPDVQTDAQREVNECHCDCSFEFADEDFYQSGLEDVSVEEEQENDNDGEENAYILDPAIRRSRCHESGKPCTKQSTITAQHHTMEVLTHTRRELSHSQNEEDL